MNILVTLTYYHPHWTGLTVIARHLAEGLAARGHTVTVLTSQHERGLPKREEINGVQVVRVPSAGRVSRTAVMPSFPVALARLTARNEVVHLHTPMPEAVLVVAQARLLGRPTLITHQGDVVMPAGVANGVIQHAMDASIGLAMRLADRVVVHAADYARHSQFLAPHAGRIDGIYPPVILPAPRPDVVCAWRQQLGLADKRVVGFAGRFVEEKGFDFLLQDLFVLPSRSDSFAMVQVEAALCGTPLVSTDIPGAREVVRATGAGRLVRPGDPVALADGIVEILRDPAPYRPSQQAVRAVFDPERSVSQYEDVLLGLVRARRAHASASADA